MKKLNILALIAVFLLTLSGCGETDNIYKESELKAPWHEYRFVAHGGGKLMA